MRRNRSGGAWRLPGASREHTCSPPGRRVTRRGVQCGPLRAGRQTSITCVPELQLHPPREEGRPCGCCRPVQRHFIPGTLGFLGASTIEGRNCGASTMRGRFAASHTNVPNLIQVHTHTTRVHSEEREGGRDGDGTAPFRSPVDEHLTWGGIYYKCAARGL